MRTRTLCSALLAAAFVVGCGGEEVEATAPQVREISVVMVTVYPQGPEKGNAETETVDCDGNPACDVPLEPVPNDVACTEIYGGPATATVLGGIDGERVDAEFSLSNGCEIARWDDASALLGDPPRMKGFP